MSRLTLIVASLILLGVGSAAEAAQGPNAEQLRRENRACEQPDGFLRATAPDAEAAVQAINAQRRQVYEQRATQERVDLAAVGLLYAAEIKSAPAYRACP